LTIKWHDITEGDEICQFTKTNTRSLFSEINFGLKKICRCQINCPLCRRGEAKTVVHGPTEVCGLQTQFIGILWSDGGYLTMGLMVQCGALLLWYHPLIIITN
jgi:hypothetical protein